MKSFCLAVCVLFSLASFVSFSQTTTNQIKKEPKTEPEIIRMRTDSLFILLDMLNDFTDHKFNEQIQQMKTAWQARDFAKFDRLSSDLNTNAMLVALLREKTKDKKGKYKAKHFIYETPRGGKKGVDVVAKGPEKEDWVVVCDCASPCIVCFCILSCTNIVACFCFGDSHPGGCGWINPFAGGTGVCCRPIDWQLTK
jgi:hypothetical protein